MLLCPDKFDALGSSGIRIFDFLLNLDVEKLSVSA